MNTRTWAWPLAALLLLGAGCTPPVEPEAVQADTTGARAVTVVSVTLRPMAGSLTASGLLVPREEVAIGSELSGYRVAQVLVDEGASVKKNQLLVQLDAGLLKARMTQAEAGVAQARAQASQAQREADRVKGLDGSGILSDEQIGSRRSQALSAEAGVQVAQAQLNDLRTQQSRLAIRAPVAGTVLERMVRPGDVASPAQTMFRLAKAGQIELDAEVPEDVLASIELEEAASVTLTSGVTLAGQVRQISPRIDPQTKLGRVRVQLPSHSELRPGGYAHVVFTRSAIPVPVVPEKAVQFEASGPLLVVIDAENRARRIPVQTGARADGFVAIEQAPPLGTQVALGGGAFLLDGDLVEPVAAQAIAASVPAAATAQPGKLP